MELTRNRPGKAGRRSESGQAITEYILLISFVVMIIVMVQRMLASSDIFGKLTKTIQQDFAHAYRYGDTRAKGPDEGGYEFHPRARPDQFRIFFNPGKK